MTIVLQGVCMNLNIFVTYKIFKNYYWNCTKDKNENIVIEQTQLIDEIKWFVCLLNLIIFFLLANNINSVLRWKLGNKILK